MGPLLRRSIGFCKDSHWQMDYRPHAVEPIADEEIRQQVCFASTGGKWDIYVLHREEKVGTKTSRQVHPAHHKEIFEEVCGVHTSVFHLCTCLPIYLFT